MPSAALRACSVMGCSNNMPCAEHNRPTQFRKENKQVYNSARWKRLRLKILRERPWCQDCLEQGKPLSIAGCTDTTTGPSQDVHHRVDLTDDRGLKFDPSNLRALSHRCHAIHTRRRQILDGGGCQNVDD